MAIEIINVGASPNDGNGDPIRDAFIKCNDNFDELDTTKIGGSGTDNFVAKFSGTDSIENSLIFDDGTNVGVNTTTPTTNLEVSGTDYSFSAGRQASNRKVSIGLNDNGQPSIQSFNSSNAPVDMTINPSGGNVGIGTLNPLGLLHLYKSGVTTRMVVDGDAGQSKIITYRTGGLQRFGMYVNNTSESGSNAGSDFQIRAYNDAGSLLSTPLFIKRSTGNVGIGTTTPSSALEIKQSTSNNSIRLGTIALGNYNMVSLNGTNAEGQFIGIAGGASADTSLYLQSGNAGNIIFRSGDGIVYNERMRILENGNVGIGTTTPVSKMHVIGGNLVATSISDVAIKSSFRVDTANPAISLTIGYDGSDNVFMQSVNSQTNSIEPLLINPYGGNVGIGTTSPTSKLQVVGLPSYADNTTALAGGLTVGAFYHTAGVLKVVI